MESETSSPLAAVANAVRSPLAPSEVDALDAYWEEIRAVVAERKREAAPA